jgi:methionyl-tRNA synthetase
MGEQVKLVEELNYKFEFKAEILDKIKAWTHKAVHPQHMRNKMLDELTDHRSHLSISRPKSRISWGIQVPGDPDQTVYVWLDALANYLTVMGRNPSEEVPHFVHFVGKDITKFHCIYWPSFLLAAFGPKCLPSLVINHGHWLKDNKKMSKSLGNIIEPLPLL